MPARIASRHRWASMRVVSRRCSTAIFRKYSVKVIRLAEGAQFRNFIPRTVCCTCRAALSSVTTHWTSSPAISERRIHTMFIRLMARRRFCTIRDAWRGARGPRAKRPRTPVWISSSHGTARSRLFMFTSTRRPHNARAEPCIGRRADWNRDRGESRDSSPPTPPYVRVPYTAVRRIKHGRCFTPCRRVRQWRPPQRFRSFSSGTSGLHPFPSLQRPVTWVFRRMAVSRSPYPSVLPSFRPSGKLVPPTTPSADFCAAVRAPHDDLSPDLETQHRPPEVRSIAFTARPPNLPPRSLMVVDFAIRLSLVRPGRPRYPVLVHKAAALLHASFRPRLATTPLRFANPSPPSGWIKDFHLQATDHARHTPTGSAQGAARWQAPA